jgi:hypothetical protein
MYSSGGIVPKSPIFYRRPNNTFFPKKPEKLIHIKKHKTIVIILYY